MRNGCGRDQTLGKSRGRWYTHHRTGILETLHHCAHCHRINSCILYAHAMYFCPSGAGERQPGRGRGVRRRRMKCNQVEINWVGRTSIRYTMLTQASLLFKIPASLFFPPHPPNPSTHLSSSVPNRLSPFSPTNAVRDLSETYNVNITNIINLAKISQTSHPSGNPPRASQAWTSLHLVRAFVAS